MAKQMMASVLTYHAQFVPVPEDLMGRMHRRVDAFVLGRGCPQVQHITQLQQASPSAAVASLPPEI